MNTPARFLFVGERPSRTSIRMRVTWEDGRLAAKQLFDALAGCGIEPLDQEFVNLFHDDRDQVVARVLKRVRWKSASLTVVAMGRKVERHLRAAGVVHLAIVHPAARGTIRNKNNYLAHVRERLNLMPDEEKKSKLTEEQATALADKLIDTSKDIYTVAKEMGLPDLDDTDYEYVEKVGKIFKCDECNRWYGKSMVCSWTDNVCAECADDAE